MPAEPDDALRPARLGASTEAERLIVRIMAVIAIAQLALMLPGIVIGWRAAWHPWLAVVAAGCCLLFAGYLVWLGWAPGRATFDESRLARRWPDLVFVVACCVAGMGLEARVEPAAISAGVTSVGFPALSIAVYVGAARLHLLLSAAVAAVAAVSHPLALREFPTPGIQGLAMLAALWAATAWGATEIRHAARDADQAKAQALRATREEAAARVHDTLGLFSMARLDPGGTPSLKLAVEATQRRTAAWSDASNDPSTHLVDEIAQLAQHFPDLPIRLATSGLGCHVDRRVGVATISTLHTLLNNVRLYAHAEHVLISAYDAADGWTLTLSDDGRGFDPETVTTRRGLTRFSRDALAHVGVSMSVRSRPGLGTQITLAGPASTIGPSNGGAGARRGRFADWRSRPSAGLARALWIGDLARAAIILVGWSTIVASLPDVAHAPEPYVVVSVLLLGAATLTAVWLHAAAPGTALAALAVCVSVAAGMLATFLGGDYGRFSNKLGPFLAVWACMFAATMPPLIPLAVALSLAAGALMAVQADLVVAAFDAAWGLLGVSVLAALLHGLRGFGSRADADRVGAITAEQQTANAVLERQLTVLRRVAAAGKPAEQSDEAVLSVQIAGEAYLNRQLDQGDLAGQLTSDLALIDQTHQLESNLTGLSAAFVPGDVGRVSTAISALVHALISAGVTLSIRGAATTKGWRVSITTGATGLQIDPQLVAEHAATLATLEIQLTEHTFIAGTTQLRITYTGSQSNEATG